MHLTQSDVDDLRLLADKAKMSGHFDAGQRLHELLDAHTAQEGVQEKIEGLEGALEEVREETKERRKALNDALDQIQTRISKLRLHRRASPKRMELASLTEEVTELRALLEAIESDITEAL